MAKVTEFNAYKRNTRPSNNKQFVEGYLADIAVDIFRSIAVEPTQENMVDFMEGFMDCAILEPQIEAVLDDYSFKNYIEIAEDMTVIRADKSLCYCLGFLYVLYYDV